MRIIAIANHKGGVGKTSTVAALAVALTYAGQKVLMVDLDEQANLTSLFSSSTGDWPNTVSAAILNGSPLPECKCHCNGLFPLFICPADIMLSSVAAELSASPDKGFALCSAIKKIRGDYDFILLDCPPNLGSIVSNALAAADELIIPVAAEAMALNGLESLLCLARASRQKLGRPKVSGVIITRYNKSRKICKIVADFLRKEFGNLVFNTEVRERAEVAEAPLYSHDVVSFRPKSDAAADYIAIAHEIINRT